MLPTESFSNLTMTVVVTVTHPLAFYHTVTVGGAGIIGNYYVIVREMYCRNSRFHFQMVIGGIEDFQVIFVLEKGIDVSTIHE